MCFLAVLLVVGTTYDILVLKFKLICQNPSTDISPLHYVKTTINIPDGTRGTPGEYLKATDSSAAENMTKEVQSSLERSHINNPAENHSGG